jgi:hypothetical protein
MDRRIIDVPIDRRALFQEPGHSSHVIGWVPEEPSSAQPLQVCCLSLEWKHGHPHHDGAWSRLARRGPYEASEGIYPIAGGEKPGVEKETPFGSFGPKIHTNLIENTKFPYLFLRLIRVIYLVSGYDCLKRAICTETGPFFSLCSSYV